MAVSAWITSKAAGGGQVLQGKDLAIHGLESVLSMSALPAGSSTGLVAVAEGPLSSSLGSIYSNVDTAIAAALTAEMTFKGAVYGETSGSHSAFRKANISKGDMFVVKSAGDISGYFTTALEVGDVIIAQSASVGPANGPDAGEDDFVVVEQNLSAVQSQITANDGDITTLNNLQTTQESAIGLNANGSYTAVGGTYVSGATIKLNLEGLKDGLVANDGEIAGLLSLQTDQESAIGLNANGTYTAVGGTYVSGATIKLNLEGLKDGLVANDAEIASNDSELAAFEARFPAAEKGRLYTDASDFVLDFTDDGKPQLRMTVVSASSEVDLAVSIKGA